MLALRYACSSVNLSFVAVYVINTDKTTIHLIVNVMLDTYR